MDLTFEEAFKKGHYMINTEKCIYKPPKEPKKCGDLYI